MKGNTRYTTRVSLIVAIGGFLMGFEASVVSGVVTFIVGEFGLSRFELGWAVASLTLTATLAMMCAGPLSDRIGRRPVLMIAALLFLASAIAAAAAPDFMTLVAARMVGGLGVGAALIVAPMYIAEISPARLRGRTVSLNQLNIVVGISAAFFSNYLILKLAHAGLPVMMLGDGTWRAMLGIEALPALAYFLALFAVPESPRWLAMHGRDDAARRVLERCSGRAQAESDLAAIRASLSNRAEPGIRELFQPSMRLVLTIGVSVAVLQQITGINAIFFYAPTIFEQSGIGTDAAFMQAVFVGLVNLVFTLLAISQIDRIGRRPLLAFGLIGIAACMLLLSFGFGSATYALGADDVARLSARLEPLVGQTWYSDVDFRQAVVAAAGSDFWHSRQAEIVSAAIDANPSLILFGVLGFVASFAISIGPVMWVLFSELFPNRMRGLAISFVGFVNSAVSFAVQLVFPWELERIGNAGTFLIYGLLAIAGLVIVMRVLPETNGRSLEELEAKLVG